MRLKSLPTSHGPKQAARTSRSLLQEQVFVGVQLQSVHLGEPPLPAVIKRKPHQSREGIDPSGCRPADASSPRNQEPNTLDAGSETQQSKSAPNVDKIVAVETTTCLVSYRQTMSSLVEGTTSLTLLCRARRWRSRTFQNRMLDRFTGKQNDWTASTNTTRQSSWSGSTNTMGAIHPKSAARAVTCS
jgi:hypothetical protein